LALVFFQKQVRGGSQETADATSCSPPPSRRGPPGAAQTAPRRRPLPLPFFLPLTALPLSSAHACTPRARPPLASPLHASPCFPDQPRSSASPSSSPLQPESSPRASSRRQRRRFPAGSNLAAAKIRRRRTFSGQADLPSEFRVSSRSGGPFSRPPFGRNRRR
jgi:hypothetical protein